MIIELGGVPVYKARLTFPKVGRWHADLECQPTDQPLPSSATLTITSDAGTSQFAGTMDANRSGVYLSSNKLRFVAGKGGWLGQTRPVHFAQGHSVQDILGAMLAAAGESPLAQTSDQGALRTGFPAYSVMADTLAAQVGVLVDVLNEGASSPYAHRFLADGTLWIGRDTFAAVDADFTLRTFVPESNAASLELVSPSLMPGQSIQFSDETTHGINHIVYVIGGSGLRAEVLFEDAA